MYIETGNINFMVYEDGVEFYGMAEIQLPDLSQVTADITGAGIAGTVSYPYIGQLEAMSLTMNFRETTIKTVKLFEPRNHYIDLRVPQQATNNTTGTIEVRAVKHELTIIPKKISLGKVAPASSSEGTNEFSVTRFATYIDNVKILEVDPINFIFEIDGTDYLEEVRKGMGKS